MYQKIHIKANQIRRFPPTGVPVTLLPTWSQRSHVATFTPRLMRLGRCRPFFGLIW